MYLSTDFDYIDLLRLGRQESHDGKSAARVALLGFCTTQYYAAALRGLGLAAGFPLVTYESEYNTVHQTVLDEQSELYSFKPDFIVFLTAVQALRNVLLSAGSAERGQVATREAEELASLVKRAADRSGATVVVNEFVMPYERPWGNFSDRVEGSLRRGVQSINERLRLLADELDN